MNEVAAWIITDPSGYRMIGLQTHSGEIQLYMSEVDAAINALQRTRMKVFTEICDEIDAVK